MHRVKVRAVEDASVTSGDRGEGLDEVRDPPARAPARRGDPV